MRAFGRSAPLLLLGSLLALGAACEGRTGGVLGSDVRTDVRSRPDVAVVRDVPLGDRDVTWRDLPPTDWVTPADGFDPVHSIGAIQQDDIGLTCDPSTPFLNHPDARTLTGVVVLTGAFRVTDTKNGYYVAEAPGPWHGVQLVVPKDLDPGLLPGDVVTVSGEAKEFYCLTQFEASDPPTVTGTSGLPPAEDVAAATLAPGGSNAEPYEGTLVRLTDVHVARTQTWGFHLAEGGVIVRDELSTGVRPAVGCPIASITGVVTYSFEEYKLVPLRAADIVYADATACGAGNGGALESVSQLQQSPESARCTTFAQTTGVYPPAGDDVRFEGLVVTTPLVYVSSNLRGYYLQEPRSEPWTGILATFGKDGAPALAPGDVVTAAGDWQEYKCLTQLKIATPVATNLAKTGTADVPAPVDVDAARLLQDADYAESFEGVLVRVAEQVVSVAPTSQNYMQVTMESGLVLDDVALYQYGGATFTVGQAFASVTGVLFGDTYDEGHYLLAPRSTDDLVPAQP
jgi:hypothetical protein